MRPLVVPGYVVVDSFLCRYDFPIVEFVCNPKHKPTAANCKLTFWSVKKFEVLCTKVIWYGSIVSWTNNKIQQNSRVYSVGQALWCSSVMTDKLIIEAAVSSTNVATLPRFFMILVSVDRAYLAIGAKKWWPLVVLCMLWLLCSALWMIFVHEKVVAYRIRHILHHFKDGWRYASFNLKMNDLT